MISFLQLYTELVFIGYLNSLKGPLPSNPSFILISGLATHQYFIYSTRFTSLRVECVHFMQMTLIPYSSSKMIIFPQEIMTRDHYCMSQNDPWRLF